MVRKIVRSKVRKPAGAGRKPTKGPRRQSDAIIIPGITGPLIPQAEAAAMGLIRLIPAAKSMYRSKEMFGTTTRDKLGKKTTTLTAKQQAAYEKKQRYLKKHGGEWQYESRTQHGLEQNFGDVPTNVFYSPKLGRMVSLTGDEAPKRKIEGGKEVYPGAQRDWVDTQFIKVSGNPEAGLGVSKTKGRKIVRGEEMQLALWHWGDQLVVKPKDKSKLGYYNLAERTTKSGEKVSNVVGMGRFQQAYITARWKPKKGEDVSAAMLPKGVGIQTEYVNWFDQPGRAATLKASKATKEGVVKKQTRKSVTKGTGTGKPAFKLRAGGKSIKDHPGMYRGASTGKSKAVTGTGKFKKKQTKTGRHSLSTKKPFRRSARVGTVEGKKYNPQFNEYGTTEVELDKMYAEAVRGKQDFTKTLNLGVWRKLNLKQKTEVFKAIGVTHYSYDKRVPVNERLLTSHSGE